jgi:hypothetical protein
LGNSQGEEIRERVREKKSDEREIVVRSLLPLGNLALEEVRHCLGQQIGSKSLLDILHFDFEFKRSGHVYAFFGYVAKHNIACKQLPVPAQNQDGVPVIATGMSVIV